MIALDRKEIERTVVKNLYEQSQRRASLSARVWFISVALMLIKMWVQPDTGNIWDEADYIGIALFLAYGISMITGMYYYYKSTSAKEMLISLDSEIELSPRQ